MSSKRLTIFKKKYRKNVAAVSGPLYKRAAFYYNVQK